MTYNVSMGTLNPTIPYHTCNVQIANTNNCLTIAEFALRLQGKCHNESNRRFAVVADKFSSVTKDSVALYL